MSPLLISLMVAVVGVVVPAVNAGDCANRTNYASGLDSCCSQFVFTNIYNLCCQDTDDNLCYCDVTLSSCIAIGGTTPAPPPPSPPTTLCPNTETNPMRRLLGGEAVDSACAARGVVGISAGESQFCNAAYVKDPETGTSALYTLDTCATALQQARTANISLAGKIANASFPLDDCATTLEEAVGSGVTKLNLSPLAAFFVENHIETCPSPGCRYNPAVMADFIDFSDCFIVSYGYTNFADRKTGLTRVPVKTGDVTQCSDGPSRSQCFVSTAGSHCIGDDGAPVYCALNTGEVTLYGIAAKPASAACDAAITSFSVIPIPA